MQENICYVNRLKKAGISQTSNNNAQLNFTEKGI